MTGNVAYRAGRCSASTTTGKRTVCLREPILKTAAEEDINIVQSNGLFSGVRITAHAGIPSTGIAQKKNVE